MDAIKCFIIRRFAKLRWKLLKSRILSLNKVTGGQDAQTTPSRSESFMEYIVTPVQL